MCSPLSIHHSFRGLRTRTHILIIVHTIIFLLHDSEFFGCICSFHATFLPGSPHVSCLQVRLLYLCCYGSRAPLAPLERLARRHPCPAQYRSTLPPLRTIINPTSHPSPHHHPLRPLSPSPLPPVLSLLQFPNLVPTTDVSFPAPPPSCPHPYQHHSPF